MRVEIEHHKCGELHFALSLSTLWAPGALGGGHEVWCIANAAAG